METDNNTVCPICTLYLRPGITLKAHLASHPKQMVIEALVRLSNIEEGSKDVVVRSGEASPEYSQGKPQGTWHQTGMPSNFPGNHSFIYQQFMSTSSQQPGGILNLNPLAQQYVTIPTVINPPAVMCPPYMYQQQVIMASGSSPFTKPIEIDLTNSLDDESENSASVSKTNISDPSQNDGDFDDEVDLSTKIEVCVTDLEPETKLDEELLSKPNKSESCQTSQQNDISESAVSLSTADLMPGNEDINVPMDISPVLTAIQVNPGQDNSPPVYSPVVNNQFLDMGGMQLMLPTDFMANHVISQVDDFECMNKDAKSVLMTIGGLNDLSTEQPVDNLAEENLSTESANVSIRADEHMPPRGELSGQESNEANSDMAWSRLQYHDGNSSMTYDLMARESWEASDNSEMDPPQPATPVWDCPVYDDTPTIVSVIEPPLNFKCSTCGEGFKCPKERKAHNFEKHQPKVASEGEEATAKTSPPKSSTKQVKKLIIKPKANTIKSENNFDNVFTNKLKLEGNQDTVAIKELLDDSESQVKCETNDTFIASCPLCNQMFPNSKALKQHKQTAHTLAFEANNQCPTCAQRFPNTQKFNEHLSVHPLECRICAKLFYRRQNMHLHMRRHLGIKPYKCRFCDKAFLTKQKRDEHINIHTGETPIKCTHCSETFRRYSNLVQHRNRYHFNVKQKVKDYICTCGEVYHSKKKLEWHKETHDSKPKACTYCNEKFIHMASLTRHMRRAHNERFVPNEERSTENVECPICKGIYLRSSLDVHIRNHSGEKPFTCSICKKDFTTKWNLKLHKWTHAARTSKPYKCDQCKGAFIREVDYTAHMNSHKSVRPFTCNYCGAQFIRKYNCQRHVKEHERGKTFSCQICNKMFHRSYYLTDHMRIHNGIRPYVCHICGKTSTTKSNHNKHLRIHHAKEQISTEN